MKTLGFLLNTKNILQIILSIFIGGLIGFAIEL